MQMINYRSEVIDYLRGMAIIDMMFVHYSQYINIVPGLNVAKIINYSDFAVEGFIFLFGMMIGSHYYPKFLKEKNTVLKRILQRVFHFITIQYVMIITVSLPVALIIGDEYTRGESVKVFIAQSFLFINQVSLLHILPTFILLLILG